MMETLIADDDFLTLRMIEALLMKWGYKVITANDGNEAWQILNNENAPRLAILDWIMPGMDGIDICRKVRALPDSDMTCLILLTSKSRKEDIVAGLEAGANDYIVKPFNHEELRVRVQIARKMIELQSALKDRVKELEKAMVHIRTLQGILPICSYCKKIRTDKNYWQQLESYLAACSEVRFSHGICPECYETYVKAELEELDKM
ncbi:response regulator [Desulfococcaceae bacterium HSG8]|nr:response regulator [Desulfococcaceae bacterium HSG8]